MNIKRFILNTIRIWELNLQVRRLDKQRLELYNVIYELTYKMAKVPTTTEEESVLLKYENYIEAERSELKHLEKTYENVTYFIYLYKMANKKIITGNKR